MFFKSNFEKEYSDLEPVIGINYVVNYIYQNRHDQKTRL